jgi:NSS family neurotransmitter:Na+ symporter
MVAFFVLTAVAATGALLSLVEVPIAILHERLRISRPRATVLTLCLLAIPAAAAALSQSWLAHLRIFGLTLFDFFDFVSSNVVLPTGGILIAVFAGWVWGPRAFGHALSNEGALANGRLAGLLSFLLRYVSPLLILVVMARGLGLW